MNELERNLRARMGDSEFVSAYRSAFGRLRADRYGDFPLHSVTLRMVQAMLEMQESLRRGEEPNINFIPYGAPGVPTPEPETLRIIQPQSSNTSSSNSGSSGGGGCYIATAVYGSYNCPQVWALRRYRDYTLAEKWYGRLFIRAYYTISPTLVKWFGNTEWFKRFWHSRLNKIVKHLLSVGVANTPYEDKRR